MTIRPLPIVCSVVVAACGGGQAPAPVAMPTPIVADHHVVLFAGIAMDARSVRGLHELTNTLGVWHYRVTETKGRVTQFDYVQPSGVIQRTYVVTYGADAHTIVEQNHAGVVLSERIVRDDGVTTIRFRDQSSLDHGCASVRLVWDDTGMRVGSQCLDSQGKIMGDTDNCASWTLQRNERGDVLENKCTLPPGETPDPKRIVTTRFAVDDNGDTIATKFFGATGARVVDDAGCAGLHKSYDSARNEVSSICLDENDQPIEGNDHVMAHKQKFDANGCLLEKHWMGAKGPASFVAKPSTERFARDAFCNEMAMENFDQVGTRRNTANAPAIVRYRRDDNLDVTDKTCLGAAMEPVSCVFPLEHRNVGSRMLFRRDAFGRVVSETCFGPSGAPTICGQDMPHERRYEYDAHGQMVTQLFFEANNKPAVRLGRMHRRTFEYNEAGLVTADRAFDADGKPVVTTLGFSVLIYTYDDRHRLSGIEARDIDAKPVGVNFCMGAKCFPNGSSKLEVVRHGGLHNVYRAPDGKLVSDVDCAQGACWE